MKIKKILSLLCAVLIAVSVFVCASAPCGLVTSASAETIRNPKNGEIIATSEGYKKKASALNGIESIKKNAPDASVVKLEA